MDQYTEGAGANKTFAQGKLLRRFEAEKQSSKRSTCSALFFSRSDLMSSDVIIGRLFDGSWGESKELEAVFGDDHSSSSLTVPELDGGSGMATNCVVRAEAGVG